MWNHTQAVRRNDMIATEPLPALPLLLSQTGITQHYSDPSIASCREPDCFVAAWVDCFGFWGRRCGRRGVASHGVLAREPDAASGPGAFEAEAGAEHNRGIPRTHRIG